MISPHVATDNEAQSDEKKDMLNSKCQEISKTDGKIKGKEELESEGIITGGGKWVNGRMSKVQEKQKSDGSTHVEEKSQAVVEVKMITGREPMIKDMQKFKAGKIVEVADTVKDAEVQPRSRLDVKDNIKPRLATKVEENNNPSDGQRPKSSPSEALSSALSKVHISSPPPRLRSKREDGEGYNRGRERRRGKPKPVSPEPKEVPMKNAVMMLNEMFPPPGAAQYKVLSMTGAPNNPTFMMMCCIEGQEFEGSGRSKKEAKLAASQLALSTLFGKDFSDVTPTASPSCPKPLASLDTWLELEGKNPVSVLNELHPEATFSLVEATGPSHSPQFCIRATLGQLQFEGRAISKKDAKLAASKALLLHLHGVGYHPLTGSIQKGKEEGHGWADTVAGLVRRQFDHILGGTTFSKRKVLAGIVLDWQGEASVLCIATGTKCINGEQLCLDGSVLNDCHAEVVARRSLLAWLYDQLTLALEGKASFLQRSPAGGFCLHPDATLHMFISTAPCGDARIFSLHESAHKAGNSGGPNRGKLRSKIESGMGTVPLPNGGRLQTWDGVVSGDRLLTMACSDKLLAWNVVGLQGALLSHWLEPVYLSSLTLGSKYIPEHVERALHGRLGHFLPLPPPHRVAQPALLGTTSPETRQPTKAQEFSANWIAGRQGPELVVGSTGRTTAGTTSRLSKAAFLKDFLRQTAVPGARDMARSPLLRSHLPLRCSYAQLKYGAINYCEARQQLMRRLEEVGAGVWVGKPWEQDSFPCS